MSKSKKPAHVWVVWTREGKFIGSCAGRDHARRYAADMGGTYAKYIPAPAPEAKPKPAPAPEQVSELTPWFDCDTPPVRPGVYEIAAWLDGDTVGFSFFDGAHWNGIWSSPESARSHADWFKRVGDEGSVYRPEDKWRGYTTNQEAAK